MTTVDAFNRRLFDFLDQSTTPFHAVKAMKADLQKAGFEPLQEADHWQLVSGGRYFVTRNDTSIIAFRFAPAMAMRGGLRMLAAHTDSPCLHVKPQPIVSAHGYVQLGVEVYGSPLLNPWFDRELSLAGRLTYRDGQSRLGSALIDYREPIAFIPSLAIHLDRTANKQRSINAQTDIPPIVMMGEQVNWHALLLSQLKKEHPNCDAREVLAHELNVYPVQAAQYVGLDKAFIASARLDNLLSCYIGLHTLLAAEQQHSLLVCSDHEEVGSVSAVGAQSTFLNSVLTRIVACSTESLSLTQVLDRSMLFSLDNAHAVHPNFPDAHDSQHRPRLNQGPVLKINANQRYASTDQTAAVFRHCAASAGVPVHYFVARADQSCGSTLGPLMAANTGVKTVDVGVPTLAMHSSREWAGSQDAFLLYQALHVFCDLETLPV